MQRALRLPALNCIDTAVYLFVLSPLKLSFDFLTVYSSGMVAVVAVVVVVVVAWC